MWWLVCICWTPMPCLWSTPDMGARVKVIGARIGVPRFDWFMPVFAIELALEKFDWLMRIGWPATDTPPIMATGV